MSSSKLFDYIQEIILRKEREKERVAEESHDPKILPSNEVKSLNG